MMKNIDQYAANIATIEELKTLLPAYVSSVNKALQQSAEVTYNAKAELNSSGYILDDGILVNGPYEGHIEIQTAVFDSLPKAMQDKVGNMDYADSLEDAGYDDEIDQIFENFANLVECIYKNPIRLNSASDNTYISLEGPLTTAQANTLADWLDLVLYENKVVDLTLSENSSVYYNGRLSILEYDTDDIISFIRYTQSNKRPPITNVSEKLANKVEDFNYYRIEVFNNNGEPQGGLFRGLKGLLDNLWEADDERYDYINEPLSWLEYNTPYPDNLDDPRINFAYKQNFYNKYLEYFKDIEAELSKLGWTVKTIKLPRPEKVIYEDDVQIAFI